MLAAAAALVVELLGRLGFRAPPSGRLGGVKVAPFSLPVSRHLPLLTGVAAGCSRARVCWNFGDFFFRGAVAGAWLPLLECWQSASARRECVRWCDSGVSGVGVKGLCSL